MQYTEQGNVFGFKIRWFIENCCEIKLSNGKTIVIDPMLVKSVDENSSMWERDFCSGFGVDDLEGCDYVLLTHVHGDHITSLKAVWEKFHPTILVNGYSAYALAKDLDIAPGAFIPAADGVEYQLPDMKVQWITGRHTVPVSMIPYSEWKFSDESEVQKELGIMGSLYNSNFVITLPNNFRIAMDNGLYEPELSQLAKYRPNLILKHKERGLEKHVNNFVDEAKRTGAQYLLSLCHQSMPEGIDNAERATNERLAELGIPAQMINPEPGKWYTVSMGLAKD